MHPGCSSGWQLLLADSSLHVHKSRGITLAFMPFHRRTFVPLELSTSCDSCLWVQIFVKAEEFSIWVYWCVCSFSAVSGHECVVPIHYFKGRDSLLTTLIEPFHFISKPLSGWVSLSWLSRVTTQNVLVVPLNLRCRL